MKNKFLIIGFVGFQFQSGAVKVSEDKKRIYVVIKFQFQSGAVKVTVNNFAAIDRFCFNSKVVRLKWRIVKPMTSQKDVSIPKWCG